MCRSIKRLRSVDQPATDEEIAAAALQFVRKVSGYRVPSRANEPAFDRAVEEIAASTRVLLAKLEPAKQTPALSAGVDKKNLNGSLANHLMR